MSTRVDHRAFWMAALLASPAAAAQADKNTSGLKPFEITISTVQEEMRYDIKEFTVQAGQPVKLTLKNPDFMPHNLMVVLPGATEEVALAAEALGAKGFELHFRPPSDKILHATKMLDYEEEETLEFIAPKKPGDYPYVCTFPKHWMMMRGVMHVIGEGGSAPAKAAPEAARHAWKAEELAGDLKTLEKGRSFEAGKAIFITKLGCNRCHKMRGEGGAVGPDLTEIFKKLKGKREELLSQILEPSKTVEEKYRAVRIKKTDDAQLFGLVTERKKNYLMIVTNPAEPVPVKVLVKDIAVELKTKTSPMPKGLLDTLKREEILDLLAYLEAGGRAEHAVYETSK